MGLGSLLIPVDPARGATVPPERAFTAKVMSGMVKASDDNRTREHWDRFLSACYGLLPGILKGEPANLK